MSADDVSSSGPRVRCDLFTRAPFLGALVVLATNDWILKPTFHNYFTGKISDFAGVFAFGWFLCALFPRHERWALALTTIGFALWKSPVADPFIGAWNALPIYDVGRVIDYSDLAALALLPAVALLARSRRFVDPPRRILATFIAACAVFIFAATGGYSVAPYEVDYDFDVSPRELVILADLHPTISVSDESREGERIISASGWNPHASVNITGNDSLARVRLREIVIPNARADSSRLLEEFELRIVQPIRDVIRDDSLMLLVRRLAEPPHRAGTATDRYTPGRAPFTLAIGERYQAGSRRLVLTVGNHSGDGVGYDPCTIHLDRFDGNRWIAEGPAFDRCAGIETVLRHGQDVQLVLPIERVPGFWRATITLRTDSGVLAIASDPFRIAGTDAAP